MKSYFQLKMAAPSSTSVTPVAKSMKPLLVVVAIAVTLVGGFLALRAGKKSSEKEMSPIPTSGPAKGEVGYQEPTHTATIGTKEVAGGAFEQIADGKIYYSDSGVSTAIQMTDEVVLACTTQDLASANELDFNLITKINPMTPSEMAGKIPAATPIVIFSSSSAGTFKAHTVAVANDLC